MKIHCLNIKIVYINCWWKCEKCCLWRISIRDCIVFNKWACLVKAITMIIIYIKIISHLNNFINNLHSIFLPSWECWFSINKISEIRSFKIRKWKEFNDFQWKNIGEKYSFCFYLCYPYSNGLSLIYHYVFKLIIAKRSFKLI